MPFINFNQLDKVKVWDGITGYVAHSESMTFARLRIKKGTKLEPHSHPHEQWTHVLEGKLSFTIGDETRLLEHGMAAHIPSNVPHKIEAHTECFVLDVFVPVREEFKKLEVIG